MLFLGAIALAAAAIYLATGGANRRGKRLNLAPAGVTRAAAEAREDASTSIPGPLDPKTLGTLRAGREGDRLSEDDIARQKMGARGRRGISPRWLTMTAYVSGGRVNLPLDVQATADCHFVVQFALQRIRPGFTAQARDRIVTRIAKAAR